MPRAKATKAETKPYTRPSPASVGGDANTSPMKAHKAAKATKGKPKPKPKANTKPNTNTVNPESTAAASDDDTKPDLNPAKPTRKRQGGPGKPWTNAEYVALFAHIAAHARRAGTGVFDGAVEGRTRNQTYLTWKVTVEPYIRKMLAEKAGKGREAKSAMGKVKGATADDVKIELEDEDELEDEEEDGGEDDE